MPWGDRIQVQLSPAEHLVIIDALNRELSRKGLLEIERVTIEATIAHLLKADKR